MTPKQPMTMHAIRVPESLWQAAKERADERDEVLSDVIRRALERYVARK